MYAYHKESTQHPHVLKFQPLGAFLREANISNKY